MYIELSIDNAQAAIVPLSAIVAIAQMGQDASVITFTHPVPSLNTNEDNALYLEVPYRQLLDKVQRATLQTARLA